MEEEQFYKVLWIDDDTSIVKATQTIAEDYQINLVHCTNWKDAEELLDSQLNDFSAIILDANCKMTADNIEEGLFIGKVLPKLTSSFNKNNRDIPWYILSAGTVSNFTSFVEIAQFNRTDFEEEWGRMLYMKDKDDDRNSLFTQIYKCSKNQKLNIVIRRHKKVFQFLGKNKYFKGCARTLLLKMLVCLYFPDDNLAYYSINDMRKIVEVIFRTAYDYGFLPEECVHKKGNMNIGFSNQFLSGSVVRHMVRWKINNSQSIFPDNIKFIFNEIIDYSNTGSHVPINDDEDKFNIELCNSYVLQLCYIINWFGKYIDDHPNILENRSHINYISQFKLKKKN